jgi:acyl-CoA reductase-like NAD-dependent aldehyde dehydrogenase
MGMVMIDDRGERAGIGFVADVPFGGPQQSGMGQPA